MLNTQNFTEINLSVLAANKAFQGSTVFARLMLQMLRSGPY